MKTARSTLPGAAPPLLQSSPRGGVAADPLGSNNQPPDDAAPAPPTLLEAVFGLMTTLTNDVADPSARLVLTARTVDGVGPPNSWQLPVRPSSDRLLELPILEVLEDANLSAWVALATRGSDGYSLRHCHALVARWTLPPVYRDSRWVPPDAIEARAALSRLTIRPSLVVVGGSPIGGAGFTVNALYRLSAPLDLQGAGQDVTRDLLKRLGVALGADADDRPLAAFSVPLPGSLTCELPALRLRATCLVCDLSRVVTIAEVEAAIRKESAV